MNNFKYISINNLQIIKEKVYDIIEKNGIPPYSQTYYLSGWDGIPDIFKQVSELAQEMKILGWYDNWIATAILVSYVDLPIHQDTGNFEYSFNLPIKNTENTFTVFYEVSAPATLACTPGTTVTYMNFDPAHSIAIESVEVIEPVLMKVKIPHNVILKTQSLPRITIAMRLANNFKTDLLD